MGRPNHPESLADVAENFAALGLTILAHVDQVPAAPVPFEICRGAARLAQELARADQAYLRGLADGKAAAERARESAGAGGGHG